MARKKSQIEISDEEAYSIYSPIYEGNRANFLKYGKDPITGKISDEVYATYYHLSQNKLKPDQVVSSARAFGRLRYKKALKKYEEAMEEWTPESGEPKPKKPHQDSLRRYIEQMANANTRSYSSAQADAIVKSGKFTISVPVIDKKTGEQKVDKETGELLYRQRKATRNDVYFSVESKADEYFWDPIRKRRKELIAENKDLGDDKLVGEELSKHLVHVISEEFFFGSK